MRKFKKHFIARDLRQNLCAMMVLFLALLTSCSSNRQQADSFDPLQNTNEKQLTLAIVGMNDFHGHLLPKERKLPDGRWVKSGGAEAFYSMIQILKNKMPNRVMIVDAGDEWQGTLESNQVYGRSVVEFFNRLGVQVAAIGNHEFDFSLENLKKQGQFAKYPYVAANILEKSTKKQIEWKNFYPSKLFEVAGIKIGVIGVSTLDTPETTSYDAVKGLEFIDPVEPVKKQAQNLRDQGAQLILVTAHAGTVCKNGSNDFGNLKSWFLRNIHQTQGECEGGEEINKLANATGTPVLDGIVAGHTHQPVHHWFNQLPTVEGEAYNQYFNIIYFTFDRESKKLIPELTRIEGLIPICEEVFEGKSHCDVRELSQGESPKLVPFYFKGQKVEADASLKKWLKPIQVQAEKYKAIILGYSELPLTHFRDREGALGNFVADVMKKAGKADIAISNSGGIRTSLEAGDITYDSIYRVYPFDNILNVIALKGKDLKMLLQIVSSGNHGVPVVSGVRLKLKNFNAQVDKVDLNQDGKFDFWEEKRLINATLSDGSPIEDQKVYKIATMDFLAKGGDNFRYYNLLAKNSDPSSPYHVEPFKLIKRGPFIRDLLIQELKAKKVINTREHPLVDQKHPRIEIVQ